VCGATDKTINLVERASVPVYFPGILGLFALQSGSRMGIVIHTYSSNIVVSQQRKKVFDFFSNPHNLNVITPGWLHFQILTPAETEIRKGTLLEYRLRLRGFPIRWLTEISEWEPPMRFVDTQIQGPYKKWIHEHLFENENGACRVIDNVQYAVPGGWLEPVIHRLFVSPDIHRIFEYRRTRLSRLLC